MSIIIIEMPGCFHGLATSVVGHIAAKLWYTYYWPGYARRLFRLSLCPVIFVDGSTHLLVMCRKVAVKGQYFTWIQTSRNM